MKSRSSKLLLSCGAGLMALALATSAWAQQRTFDLPAQEATKAVPEFARQAGVQLVAPGEQLRGVWTKPVRGQLDTRAALAAMLEGTGLSVASDDGSIITLRRTPGRPQEDVAAVSGEEPETVSEVLVTTGTRIRGAEPTSPVTTITLNEMRTAGQTDLGQVIRAVPQNFIGGQNPGVGAGIATSEDVTGASSLNLRGLGADATLTLVNGRRLAYDGVGQGIDISAIPMAAIERLEIVADGASALYGSDAVGGVANVLLKRDYRGVELTGRLGISTDGGGFQRQLSLVSGATWGGGGFIIALDGVRSADITAGQRSYTRDMASDTTLYPGVRQYSGTLSGHQAVSEKVEIGVDAGYSKRDSSRVIADGPGDPYSISGVSSTQDVVSYVVAPRVGFKLPGNWQLDLSGTFGESRAKYTSSVFSFGDEFPNDGEFNNRTEVVETSAEGGLLKLPAGNVRLAAGAGWREIHGENISRTPGSPTIGYSDGQSSLYGYGELFVPIVSSGQHVRAIEHLSITGAVRVERYRDMDTVATPKLGLSYRPTPNVELKLSWGKSYKAPRLSQQYAQAFGTVYPVARVGGTGFPATATALVLAGGRRELSPERAETGAATLVFRPSWAQGARIEISYFTVAYRDRVIAPINSTSTALRNSLFADFVTLRPSSGEVASAYAAAVRGVNGFFGANTNPANIVAIIDNRQWNAARQRARGVDASVTYPVAIGGGQTLDLVASGTYLESTQRLIEGQPETQLAGRIFYPPHYRLRAGAVWAGGPVTLASYANYTSHLSDQRLSSFAPVDDTLTVDATATMKVNRGAGPTREVTASLAVMNIFNTSPPRIRMSDPSAKPYDEVNYSAVGRTISVSLTKAW